MSLFVQASDFSVGELKLARGQFSEPDLQNTIDRLEPSILKDLLGCDLYDLFTTDWDPVTKTFSTARFTDLYNAFCEDDNCGQVRSKGMKEMLKYFVWYEYISEQAFQNRVTGERKQDAENSTRAKFDEFAPFTKYNEAIDTYWAIQWFMCENSSTYPEENSLKKEKVSWL